MSFKLQLFVVVCVALAAMQASSAQVLSVGPTARSGLQVHPMPDLTTLQEPSGLVTIQSTLIRYSNADMDSIRQWTDKLDELLRPYRKNIEPEDFMDPENTDPYYVRRRVRCSYLGTPGAQDVCDVPVEDFYPCTLENNYNYHRRAPCIFLKLDDTLNWKPKYYNTTSLISQEMLEDLKEHIRVVSDSPEANTVWVSCEGENPADVEFLGPVQYIPRRGFPSFYYPFTNKQGYLSPLVAVLFQKPRTGVVIMVKCQAWSRDATRYAHFELLIDD